MFDINIKFENIDISSLESEDIVPVQKWLNIQQSYCTNYDKPVGLEEFYNRFLNILCK